MGPRPPVPRGALQSFPDDLAVALQHLRQPWSVTIAHQHVTRGQPPLLDAALPIVHRLCHHAGLPHDRREGKAGRNVLPSLGRVVFDYQPIVAPRLYM
jgi:hypothetical protein